MVVHGITMGRAVAVIEVVIAVAVVVVLVCGAHNQEKR
jgi:hypothetical protein